MITPALASEIRRTFGLDPEAMGELVGVSRRQWFRYEDGTTPVPKPVEKYLIVLMRYAQVRQDVIGTLHDPS